VTPGVKASTSTVLPANSSAKVANSLLVDKGKQMLDRAAEITRFFNRDSNDEASMRCGGRGRCRTVIAVRQDS
jgi:hypothetical protein